MNLALMDQSYGFHSYLISQNSRVTVANEFSDYFYNEAGPQGWKGASVIILFDTTLSILNAFGFIYHEAMRI